MTKSLPIDYYPLPVPSDPEQLPRFLEEELHRIRESMVARPVALSIRDEFTVLVTTTLTWERLFDDGIVTPDWDVPGGSFDNTTGEWTCPQSGLYSVDAQMEVSPFGAGNKTYYAGLRIYWLRSPTVTFKESTDGGDDAIPLGVSISGLLPLQQGDVLAVEAAIVHEQFVGSADVKVGWQILRESGG